MKAKRSDHNGAIYALRRLLRSLDVRSMAYDFNDAAQSGRELLEDLGHPVRNDDPDLIKRAYDVMLLPYREAKKYGDDHPIGTYTVDVDVDVAVFLEDRFSMETENAPDGYDVRAIFNDPNGDGCSVSCDNEEEEGFITLTCRDRSDPSGQFTMMVGPDRLKDATEALEEYRTRSVLERISKRLHNDVNSFWKPYLSDENKFLHDIHHDVLNEIIAMIDSL